MGGYIGAHILHNPRIYLFVHMIACSSMSQALLNTVSIKEYQYSTILVYILHKWVWSTNTDCFIIMHIVASHKEENVLVCHVLSLNTPHLQSAL